MVGSIAEQKRTDKVALIKKKEGKLISAQILSATVHAPSQEVVASANNFCVTEAQKLDIEDQRALGRNGWRMSIVAVSVVSRDVQSRSFTLGHVANALVPA